MYIVTDDKIYTEELFSDSFNWLNFKDNRLSEQLTPLIRSLFKDSVTFCSNISDFNNWDLLFITKYSENSQFDQLNQFLSENELEYNILVLAGSGQKFHGFRNRSWASLPGNLHLTAYINSSIRAENSSAQMMVLSSVSCLEAIQEISNNIISPQIKWMNDIIIDNAKVGGVITQGRIQGEFLKNLLLGIGVNLNAIPKIERDEVIPNITSVSKELNNKSIRIIAFLRILSKNLLKNFNLIKEDSFELLYKKYVNYSYVIKKNVKIISDPIKGKSEKLFEGIVESISERLELKLDNYDDYITKGRIVSLEASK